MRKIIGQVVNGKFIDGKPEKVSEQPLHREFVRNSMREKYSKDCTQPYKHGKANPDYIRAWGKSEASQQFTPEQIKEAMND